MLTAGIGVPDAFTVQGGVAGLAIAACMAVLGVLARRLDKGDTAAMASLRDLCDRLTAERDRILARLDTAESEAGLEKSSRWAAQEYARGLEDRLAIPHRDWT